jgi:hypothetical protein
LEVEMGGKSGGGISLGEMSRLESVAKDKLGEAAQEEAKHVFISFAHEDMAEVNLLRGQAKNERNDLVFDDYSVKEAFDSKNADYIKSQIREKIDRVSVTVVYLSSNAAKSKWVNWEIEESFKRGKGVIGVYGGDKPPAETPAAFSANKCNAVNWSHEAITGAINVASNKRK